MEAKCIPPLGALSSDIECRATRFVAAGCLPRSTLAEFAGEDKGTISTARGRDDCGKALSQHLSFGATIRATQGCDPSAESSPEWMAAFGPPLGYPAAPSKRRPNFVQPLGSTSPVRDTQGREKVGVSAVTKISRKEFGIRYNPLMETGGVAVSDEVSVILDLELIRNQQK